MRVQEGKCLVPKRSSGSPPAQPGTLRNYLTSGDELHMIKLKKLVLSTAVVATAAVPIVASSPAHAAGSYYGCPYGAVCIYNNCSYSSGISNTYWSYGATPLYNQYGHKRLLNNQYDGAKAAVATNASASNPNGFGDWLYPVESTPSGWDYSACINMDPMNYVVLKA